MWSMSVYAVPLIATFMYHRNYSLTDNAFYLSKLVASASVLLITSLAARSYSRVNNPVYVKFIQTLNEAHLHYNKRTKQELLKYDFEFWGWPVDFDILKLKRLITYFVNNHIKHFRILNFRFFDGWT
jgi:DNA-dependent RNA polymerase auxiliary subunit epsilon